MTGLTVQTITDRMTRQVVSVEGHGVGIYVRLHGADAHAAVRGAIDLHRGAVEYAHLVDFAATKTEAARRVFGGGMDRAAWRIP